MSQDNTTAPWRYVISTGQLFDPAGQMFAIGYSGRGDGLNNPAEDALPDTGPLPIGRYTIGPAFTHPSCGPIAMRLIPDAADDMHGRGGFLVHGDNAARDHTASHGCIILDRPYRVALSAATDRTLEVAA